MIQANMLGQLLPGVTPLTEEEKKRIAKECKEKHKDNKEEENKCIVNMEAQSIQRNHVAKPNGNDK